MEYKFIITAVEKQDKDNLKDVVVTIHWRYQDVNDSNLSTFGSYTFEEINTNNFVDYSKLDENIVTSWLNNVLDIKELQDKIESQKEKSVPNIVHFPFAKTLSEQVPNIEMPTIEMPNIEIPNIEMPTFEAPKFEIPTFEPLVIEPIKFEPPVIELPKIEPIVFDMPKFEMPVIELPKP